MANVLPERIEGPEGLLLRRWVRDDAEVLGAWAREWAQGGDAIYGVFVDDQVAGGCGLHRRIAPGGLEIGYWIHSAWLRQGLAPRRPKLASSGGGGWTGGDGAGRPADHDERGPPRLWAAAGVSGTSAVAPQTERWRPYGSGCDPRFCTVTVPELSG